MYQAKARFAASPTMEDIKVGASHIKWNEDRLAEDSLTWLAPVEGTIYGTMFNYKEQLEQLKDTFLNKPYNEPPKRPVLYIKPRNTVNAHMQEITIPQEVDQVGINGTLGVVISKDATNVAEELAMEYIDGYTIVNDITVPHTSFHRPAIKNKARDGFCPIGPWIVQKNDIPDPGQLMIRTFINDELVQTQPLNDLNRSIPQLLSDVTEYMTLSKGDVLLVGIPLHAPLAVPGDTVRVEIDSIGGLENKLNAEKGSSLGGIME